MDDRVEEPPWETGLAALRAYVKARGTAKLASRARANGVPLGEWATDLRARYWAGTLEPDQVELLEQLPGWDWGGRHRRRWLIRYQALRRYVDAHGTAEVPLATTIGKIRLGQWVATQRACHAAGTLPRANIERLEEVPGWRWHNDDPDPAASRWKTVLAALQTYCDRTGNSNPPYDTSVEGLQLGRWVRQLRDAYRNGALPAEISKQVALLPGWSWDPEQDEWDHGLHMLLAWISARGHASPAQDAVIDGYPVGLWVHNQRRQHRAGRLATDRCARLEGLPGWRWRMFDSAWNEAMQLLEDYTSVHHTTQVPLEYTSAGVPLGAWVRYQRMLKRRQQLRPDRAARLEALAGWTWDNKT